MASPPMDKEDLRRALTQIAELAQQSASLAHSVSMLADDPVAGQAAAAEAQLVQAAEARNFDQLYASIEAIAAALRAYGEQQAINGELADGSITNQAAVNIETGLNTLKIKLKPYREAVGPEGEKGTHPKRQPAQRKQKQKIYTIAPNKNRLH